MEEWGGGTNTKGVHHVPSPSLTPSPFLLPPLPTPSHSLFPLLIERSEAKLLNSISGMQYITVLSHYKKSASPDPNIVRTLEEQLIKNGGKLQTEVLLRDMGLSDRAGVTLIRCMMGYSPLTSIDLSGYAQL